MVNYSPVQRALAVSLFGWLPISFYQTVGEGHNDIVMVFFLLLWMYLVSKNKYQFTALTLTASALIKYITAPLLLLEIIQAGWKQGIFSRKYLFVWVVSVLFVGIVLAPFWRGFDFFRPVTEMRSWAFLTPAYALISLAYMIHIPLLARLSPYLTDLLFVGFVFYYGIDFYRYRKFREFEAFTLAVLCAVLFMGVGHVWPWFIIWVLAPAAVALDCGLLRFVLPVGVLGIFLNLYWLVASDWKSMNYASIAFYAGVIGLMMFFHYRPLVKLSCSDLLERSSEVNSVC